MIGWLDWWAGGFIQQADACWSLPLQQLAPALQQRLLQDAAQALPLTGVSAIAPETPPPWLPAMLALSPDEMEQAMRLVAAIVQPQAAPILANPADKLWCQRLHRALRPDRWYQTDGDGSLLPLRLLQQSLSSGCWQRLRLRYPPPRVASVDTLPVAPLPAAKVNLLWPAALWRLEEQARVDR